jgi:hypothetical protein
MRDLRDPLSLGDLYLEMRGLGVSIERAVTLPAEKYQNGPWISANPAHHHSKTPQTIGDLSDGA